MSAGCAGCGDCCKVIGLASPPSEFETPVEQINFVGLPKPDPNVPLSLEQQREYQIALAQSYGARHEYVFIQQHFHPVSREEAIAINPLMAHPQRENDAFYTCDVYDPETGHCGAHDERPALCREFPWYGVLKPNPLALVTFPRCSYWHDVPRSLWPTGVEPLPDPDARPLPTLAAPQNCC